MNTAALPDLASLETQYDGDQIVTWEHPKSLVWLTRTPANKSFTKLARFYEPQADKFMCGPATIAIVLNCLKMGSKQFLPFDSEHEAFARRMNPQLPSNYRTSFQRFTQKNIFINCSHLKSIADVYGSHPGLTLKEMHDIFGAHGVNSRIHYASTETVLADFESIAHALAQTDRYIVANFDRSAFGMKGGGHISPIAALDISTKKALVMDVNMCGQWIWVDLFVLLKSMQCLDGNLPRGFLILSA